jgi:hypothetical protein
MGIQNLDREPLGKNEDRKKFIGLEQVLTSR